VIVPSAPQRLFAHSAGERTVPGIWHETYWFARHEACYRLVADLVREATGLARVLDAGSGEGFGASMLATEGARVVALDYDPAATAHHAQTYPDVPVARGNLVGLPVRDGSMDLVVSLQTVEHVWDQPRFVRECARALRPGGRAVLSTPNRLTFPPGNVFHHRELDADELAELLAPAFASVTVRGLTHGRRLAAWEREYGSIVDAQLSTLPEQWSPTLAEAVQQVTADDFVLTDDLAGCLDLVAIAATA
jgi:2-polyprenyl-3-methyl-5-hydroxy-6-metoxy-1,4-benzoquinol methylase